MCFQISTLHRYVFDHKYHWHLCSGTSNKTPRYTRVSGRLKSMILELFRDF
ncbi:unnamed protein product [Moneuplotes crassus]|uniref:Uncharacterized protein n=1 Tax=Euplotes crassus TaxID=5936 RepID=A0AAD1U4G4_EUPCR|nr:unnamed protein product [Moneuplotes crassus]